MEWWFELIALLRETERLLTSDLFQQLAKQNKNTIYSLGLYVQV